MCEKFPSVALLLTRYSAAPFAVAKFVLVEEAVSAVVPEPILVPTVVKSTVVFPTSSLPFASI